MNDYVIFYAILIKDSNDTYIGYSRRFTNTQEILNNHVFSYTNWISNPEKSYKFLSVFKLFNKHGVNNCSIKEIERLPSAYKDCGLRKLYLHYTARPDMTSL